MITTSTFGLNNKLYRIFWHFCYVIFFKYSPVCFFRWRVFILKFFGADISWQSRIYPTCKIWSPKNLIIEEFATIGPWVNIYNQGKITIHRFSTISQNASLCASSHRYQHKSHELILCPIIIESYVWVCAEAFVGPNVHIAEGTVLGARAVAKENLEPWSVYDGNPCLKVKDRILKNE
jgi:putative colanic acid biosynthesis acetyltransferase WcaF